MKRVFEIVHILACIAAMIFGWQFLKSFSGHFENGIWDSSAVTATALIIVMITAVFLHMTHFISQYFARSTFADRHAKKTKEH